MPSCQRRTAFFFSAKDSIRNPGNCRSGRVGLTFSHRVRHGSHDIFPELALNKRRAEFVRGFGGFMRGIIIKSVSPEDLQTVRRLRAIEGYVDLGMFPEAEE